MYSRAKNPGIWDEVDIAARYSLKVTYFERLLIFPSPIVCSLSSFEVLNRVVDHVGELLPDYAVQAISLHDQWMASSIGWRKR